MTNDFASGRTAAARTGRVRPVHLIRGTAGTVAIHLVDLSDEDLRISHREALPPVNADVRLSFEHDGETFDLHGTVGASTVFRAASAPGERSIEHTTVRIAAKSRHAAQALRSVVERRGTAANAAAPPAATPAPAPPRTTEGGGMVRCELRGGTWTLRPTSDRQQPEVGFTVAASEGMDKIDMLCRTFATSDDSGRDLIRRLASLSLKRA